MAAATTAEENEWLWSRLEVPERIEAVVLLALQSPIGNNRFALRADDAPLGERSDGVSFCGSDAWTVDPGKRRSRKFADNGNYLAVLAGAHQGVSPPSHPTSDANSPLRHLVRMRGC
jgi:hypothetical protein